jgi:hypothetical protein
LVKKFNDNLKKMTDEAEKNQKQDIDDMDAELARKAPQAKIPEPNPGPNHTMCAICKV